MVDVRYKGQETLRAVSPNESGKQVAGWQSPDLRARWTFPNVCSNKHCANDTTLNLYFYFHHPTNAREQGRTKMIWNPFVESRYLILFNVAGDDFWTVSLVVHQVGTTNSISGRETKLNDTLLHPRNPLIVLYYNNILLASIWSFSTISDFFLLDSSSPHWSDLDLSL